jgi:exoribonuclease R
MLPRVLCETMCSLNPGLERLTLSIWFKVDEDGKVF